MLRKFRSVVDYSRSPLHHRIQHMITLQEDLFRDLVLRSNDYVVINQETKYAIENSDYGEDFMVVENDPDTVGWAGSAIGEVRSVENGKGKLYRLWSRETWKIVGNLARERAAERERKCAEADARQAAKLKDLKQRCRDVGITEENIALMFDNMSEKDIRKMTGL